MGYSKDSEEERDCNMTFRFDDVCINADMLLIQRMTDYLFDELPQCKVIYGVSPLVHQCGTDPVKKQRVFPEIYNALSDYRNFYKVEKAGIPQIDSRVRKAGHGLIHVDHRLLTKEVQELSILASCTLVKADMFIPPFNKWNRDTEAICDEHEIKLVKFEDGWLSMEHNDSNHHHELWYLHSREWTFEKFVAWFQSET
jgi:hypothetical protein